MGTNTLQVREATPDEQAEWFETDYFMKGDFDVMKLFVVILKYLKMQSIMIETTTLIILDSKHWKDRIC